MPRTPSFSGTPRGEFAATQWTVVLAAADGAAGSGARRALEKLAQTYWFPLYAYIRRRGLAAAEAEDLTQEFFSRLLEKKSLASVDRAKGKFRSFLLASLKNFLANEADKARAEKRGGWKGPISLDAADAEARYGIEPAEDMTPEKLFERRWAWTVLDGVLERLREQYRARGESAIFDELKVTLTSGSDISYAKMAQKLEISEGAVAVAAHRLRGRYRKLLREQIAQTVADPGLIDDEIQYLLSCL
jgi:RNA polymerase sigma factor (sigma-70 family)